VLPEEILERRGRLLRFNPSCSTRYCEHSSIAYQLTSLASPMLDDLVLVERWPALAAVTAGSGPHAVSTSVGGIPVTFYVADNEDETGFDPEDLEARRSALAADVDAPHVLDIYDHGRVHHLPIEPRGEWLDLASLLGAFNTILAAHRSELRFLTLDPHCSPCAHVVVGPASGLVAASIEGLLEPVDPYHYLWTEPTFDPGTPDR
jgi:hypothetical protein